MEETKKIKLTPKQKEHLRRELKARMKIRNKRLEERRQYIYK